MLDIFYVIFLLTVLNVLGVLQAGDVVCEIELEQFSVGVTVETFGFLAEIRELRTARGCFPLWQCALSGRALVSKS